VTHPISVVDAFTDRPFHGNPAAVVQLAAGDAPGEPWMQRVAAEMKHSETAFVHPRADGAYDLRWFTPEVEVDLCGHATLASAHVLWESGRLAPGERARFHTRGGELRARLLDDGAIELDFPTAPPEPCPEPDGLLAALGVDAGETYATTGRFFMVVVPEAGTVHGLAPDVGALRALTHVRGVYVTAAADDRQHDIVSRCFAPAVGIDEDPVTGSMHCVIGPFWSERIGRTSLVAHQASPRGGTVVVRVAGDRTLLAGRAVTVLHGELLA
jgi:PhzF family phenazine biosynthesis protein